MPMLYKSPSLDIEMSFTVKIVESAVDADCSINRYERTPSFLASIQKPVFDFSGALVDLIAFSKGIGLTLIFDRIIDPTGSSLFLPSDPSLVPLCTAFSLTYTQPGDGLFDVAKLVISEPPVFISLREIIESITLTHHAAANCGRAIERLRQLIAPKVDGKKTWETFGELLRLDKKYIDYINLHATGPRHGNPAHVTGDVTTEMVRRTWTIMNRFMEFRKRGNVQLPLSDFPILTDPTWKPRKS